jgi:hypothetical protein
VRTEIERCLPLSRHTGPAHSPFSRGA